MQCAKLARSIVLCWIKALVCSPGQIRSTPRAAFARASALVPVQRRAPLTLKSAPRTFRPQLDVIEANLRAAQRAEQIERASKLLYRDTDKVKTFNSSLLLSDVLEERKQQVEIKAMRARSRFQPSPAPPRLVFVLPLNPLPCFSAPQRRPLSGKYVHPPRDSHSFHLDACSSLSRSRWLTALSAAVAARASPAAAQSTLPHALKGNASQLQFPATRSHHAPTAAGGGNASP